MRILHHRLEQMKTMLICLKDKTTCVSVISIQFVGLAVTVHHALETSNDSSKKGGLAWHCNKVEVNV